MAIIGYTTCDACSGTGKIPDGTTCDFCLGKGLVAVDQPEADSPAAAPVAKHSTHTKDGTKHADSTPPSARPKPA